VTARQRFERALEIDDAFGETYGSLAVLDVIAGDIQSARRQVAIARRLDKDSFSAMLALALLARDNPAAGKAIIDEAMTKPINERGMTLASYLAGLTKPTMH
jgi:Flp pilus assembly protein TadD